jgi:hypothetical protein
MIFPFSTSFHSTQYLLHSFCNLANPASQNLETSNLESYKYLILSPFKSNVRINTYINTPPMSYLPQLPSIESLLVSFISSIVTKLYSVELGTQTIFLLQKRFNYVITYPCIPTKEVMAYI